MYRLAVRDPTLSLHIYTALTLEKPRPSTVLERRFLGPIIKRLYDGAPEFEYAAALRDGTLPDNIRVYEFYLQPGAWLNQPDMQRNYISVNYTHVARTLVAARVNAVAQLVAETPDSAGPVDSERLFSLACNPDLTLDLLDATVAAGHGPPLLIAETCAKMPYMGGDALIAADRFDVILSPCQPQRLFPIPNRPVSLTSHAIGFRAAALIPDGGTLQIGIGGLGETVAYATGLRQTDNDAFRAMTTALGVPFDAQLGRFNDGLYGMSEMFVEGFLYLRDHGVLKRTVRDDIFLDAGFFLGSARFYERLRNLTPAEQQGINMTRISFTNQLLGDESGRRRDRVRARFMNTAMMATLTGAVVSDGLEGSRVVSGVGGQYNFVAMAHQLDDARSIIMLPATRISGGKARSNIVWQYGHETIPRHLRDIVITEYGVADLRSQPDEEVIIRMLGIADSRFQADLCRQAVAAGKLSSDYRIPPDACHNTPEALQARLGRVDLANHLPFFPLGSDFTAVETELAAALDALSTRVDNWRQLLTRLTIGPGALTDSRVRQGLARMGLDRPASVMTLLPRLLVAGALALDVYSSGRPLLGAEPAPDDGVR